MADSTCKSTALKIRQPIQAGRKLVGFLPKEQVRPVSLLLCLLAEILLIALLVRVRVEMELQHLPPRVHEKTNSVCCHFGGYLHLKCLSLHSTKDWNRYYICNNCSFCRTAKSHTNQEQPRTSNNKPIAHKNEQQTTSNDPTSDVTKLDTKFQIPQLKANGLREKVESILKFI